MARIRHTGIEEELVPADDCIASGIAQAFQNSPRQLVSTRCPNDVRVIDADQNHEGDPGLAASDFDCRLRRWKKQTAAIRPAIAPEII